MTVTINSQSLLCICLLAFLLLPLSLSCNTKKPPNEVEYHFRATVKTELTNTDDSVKTSLQNLSCPELKHKLPNCTADKENIVNTLLILACRMQNLGLSHTEELTTSITASIDCLCNRATKKLKTATRQRERKKLCKAKEILSSMTRCYEMLITLSKDR